MTKIQKLITIFLVFSFYFLFSSSIYALTISPVKFEITGEPGQELLGEIILFNERDRTETFYSSFENFEARGEGGTPHFVPGIEGLATWITAPDKVVLEPGERKTIPFNIKIPHNADPGGHFAAIFWGTVPPQLQEGGQILVGAKVGTLVLLSVPGEIEIRGGILEFEAEKEIFIHLPITFFYRFGNDGGDRILPRGEIKIRDIFDNTVVVLDANPALGNVLPGSMRKFEIMWGAQEDPNLEEKGFFAIIRHQWQNFVFGAYTAYLNLAWVDYTDTATVKFFVIPWQLLSTIIIILVIIAFLGIIGIKRYNQWIITKAITKVKEQQSIPTPETKKIERKVVKNTKKKKATKKRTKAAKTKQKIIKNIKKKKATKKRIKARKIKKKIIKNIKKNIVENPETIKIEKDL